MSKCAEPIAKGDGMIYYKNVLPWRNFEKLYLNERSADVWFVFHRGIENVVRIPAHKNILSAGSDIFDAMFYGELKQEGDITVIDESPDAFREFLQFFYLATVKLTVENASDVMHLAEAYMVTDCQIACTDLLHQQLTLENMCLVWEIASVFQMDKLRKRCEKEICKNAYEIFQSISFMKSGRCLVHQILMLPLECGATIVFDGCLAWAKAACIQKSLDGTDLKNVRIELGDLFHHIRFAEMSLESFTVRYQSHEGIFTKEEFEDIIQKITTYKFNPGPRHPKRTHPDDNMLICDRNDTVDSFNIGQSSSNSMDITVFSTNQLMLLKTIYCSPLHGTADNINDVPAKIFIIARLRVDKIIYSSEVTLNVGRETVIKVPLVRIKPDIKYTIGFQLDNRTWRCSNSIFVTSSIECGEDAIIKFHDFRGKCNGVYATASNSRGIVSKLHFSK